MPKPPSFRIASLQARAALLQSFANNTRVTRHVAQNILSIHQPSKLVLPTRFDVVTWKEALVLRLHEALEVTPPHHHHHHHHDHHPRAKFVSHAGRRSIDLQADRGGGTRIRADDCEGGNSNRLGRQLRFGLRSAGSKSRLKTIKLVLAKEG
jgi:hypothetical protein